MHINPSGGYPSDLTNAQWNYIRPFLPKAKPGGRPRSTNIRHVVDAIFYMNRTGSPWRYLPKHYPPWQTVYHYFAIWKNLGIWKRLHDKLVRTVRRREGRHETPSCTIIDSQAVKSAIGSERGYDGFKKIRGRKRQILVDTLGFLHAVKVQAANRPDSLVGDELFKRCSPKLCSHLEAIYADLGYRGAFVSEVERRFGFAPTISNPDPNKGQGLAKTTREKKASQRLRGLAKKRWIVERTFAWLNHFRRLSRDYEHDPSSSEAMIYLAMTQIVLHRLWGAPAPRGLRL